MVFFIIYLCAFSLLQNRHTFVDDEFPPSSKSLFYNPSDSSNHQVSNYYAKESSSALPSCYRLGAHSMYYVTTYLCTSTHNFFFSFFSGKLQVDHWLRPNEIATDSSDSKVSWTVFRTPLPSDISQGIVVITRKIKVT